MRTRAAVLRAAGEPAPYAESRPLGVEDVQVVDDPAIVALRGQIHGSPGGDHGAR